jgi:predicted nucleotidyltransferase
MKINGRLEVPDEALAEFCQKWKITEFAFFGSVLREDFGPESDVDVLVRFEDGAHWTLFDLVHMEDELAEIFGRKVDLVERAGVEESPNYIRRRRILGSAETVYVRR